MSDGQNTRFQRLCNSLNFWKRKLKPAVIDNSVILTLYNEARNVKLDIASLILAMEEVDASVEVSGFSEFRNPRYLCFYFHTKEQRDLVLDRFRSFEDNYVVFLSWALCDSITSLNVHWLPLALDIEIVKKEVDKYAFIVSEERKALSMMSGKNIPSGKLSFGVKMKEGVTVESVPHLTDIGGMEALITIQGRQPLCLNCDRLGHISRRCKMRHCQSCRKLMPKKHICSRLLPNSYADVTRGVAARDIDPDMEEDDELNSDEDSFNEEQVQALKIAEQIKDLEGQLRRNDVDENRIIKVKNKRKANDGALDFQTSTGVQQDESVSFSGLPSKTSKEETKPDHSPADVIGLDSKPLSFEGLSSLTPKAQNKKSYSKPSNRSSGKVSNSKLLFDKTFFDTSSVFSD